MPLDIGILGVAVGVAHTQNGRQENSTIKIATTNNGHDFPFLFIETSKTCPHRRAG